jgi:hypothetical protein
MTHRAGQLIARRRTRRRSRLILAIGVGTVLALGLISAALALWAANGSGELASFAVGGVSFYASSQSNTTPVYSPDGGPVTLTLPGSEIASVLGQSGPNPAPVIWQFTVTGYADGITGLDYDITAGAQAGTSADLGTGMAAPGTVFASATIKVYPAAVNGGCSAVPATPTGDPGKNLYFYDNLGHTLQAAGAFTGAPVSQSWCVAIASAAGDSSGIYRNRADASGIGHDGTTSRASDLFEAPLGPGQSNEPDVTLLLDPAVTSLNPGVPTGDHFTDPNPAP